MWHLINNNNNDYYGIIYKAKNKVNGKVYIGQTSVSLKARMDSHRSAADAGRGYVFQRAIKKYGFENFEWEEIDSAKDKDELCEKEIYWIEFYNSFIRNKDSNGYNMTKGGEGWSGVDHSGEKNSMFGKKHSDESRYRNMINQETRKPVLAYDFKGSFYKEFPSINKASNDVLGDFNVISKACKGIFHHAYQYIWFYKDDFSEDLLNKKLDKLMSRIPKRIVQCDLNGNYIKTYEDAEKCAKEIDGCASTILKCCKGKVKIHKKKYTFFYEDDYKGA